MRWSCKGLVMVRAVSQSDRWVINFNMCWKMFHRNAHCPSPRRWSCEGLVMVRAVSWSDRWVNKNRSRCHRGGFSPLCISSSTRCQKTFLFVFILVLIFVFVPQGGLLSTVHLIQPEKQLYQIPHIFIQIQRQIQTQTQIQIQIQIYVQWQIFSPLYTSLRRSSLTRRQKKKTFARCLYLYLYLCFYLCSLHCVAAWDWEAAPQPNATHIHTG